MGADCPRTLHELFYIYTEKRYRFQTAVSQASGNRQ